MFLTKNMNKKILLSLAAALLTASMNAQNVRLYRAGELVASYSASEVDSVVFVEETPQHAYVEIGGNKWATMNVGATSATGKPAQCYGDYFAWGETKPRYTGITFTSIGNATFSGWTDEHPDGYVHTDYPTYEGAVLDAEHDAATQNWGADWRTPTVDDFRGLIYACTGDSGDVSIGLITTKAPQGGIYWLTEEQEYLPEYNGAAGVLFIDRADTSRRLFLPAMGEIHNNVLYLGGLSGFYYGAELDDESGYGAEYLCFLPSGVYPQNTYLRFYAHPVRGVMR